MFTVSLVRMRTVLALLPLRSCASIRPMTPHLCCLSPRSRVGFASKGYRWACCPRGMLCASLGLLAVLVAGVVLRAAGRNGCLEPLEPL